MIPRATYRLQFHKDFNFAQGAALADYLAALGVSHVYTSPILTARAGSLHGYDVVDHSRINPELGGEKGFRTMAAAFRAHGLGIILDIVPNHMAVGKADNPWWQDLLANGRASSYAGTFDIDWDAPGLEGRVLVPFLDGDPQKLLAKGDLKLTREDTGWAFAYFDHRFPLRPEDQQQLGPRDPRDISLDSLRALLERQHFVPADWREADARINWRRFFDITELAAIRVGEPVVFEAVHAKVFALYAEELIDGVRVDHIDGLADPRAYCHILRARLGALGREPYLVVEKILAEDEKLPSDWACDGTTGYDFMNEVSALQHAETGVETLDRLWRQYGGRDRDFETEEAEARREIVTARFAAQLAATVRAFARIPLHIPSPELQQAIIELIVNLRCYRDYTTGAHDSPPPGPLFLAAVKRASARMPQLAGAIAALAGLFASHSDDRMVMDALRRFHQLSAPVAAKAVEDTALYRFGRLLSRNDVGFDPRVVAMPAATFHGRMQERAQAFPAAMLATATHDHKRGEDSRARLAVLSEAPVQWQAFVAETEMPAGLHTADVYQLLQTLVGVWPIGEMPGEALAARVGGWCEKFLREAKLRSSWQNPDTDYEKKLQDHAHHLILSPKAGPFRRRLGVFLAEIGPAAQANALVQTVLRYTVPGMPDLYQGCEFIDLSLVDPDNRRPVDFTARAAALRHAADPSFAARKQRIIAALLKARQANPDLWRLGDYRPLEMGEAAIGFMRRHDHSRLTAIARRHLFGDAPEGSFVLEYDGMDLLTGTPLASGVIALSVLFQTNPAVVIYARAD
ncbi:MAG TPA: malto-oligosyltrehalose synthase [Rhizomicrobium sp.]|nr:malto-oligosyltrehalose synthase [Rhizomicrobium sp.]